MVNLEDFHRVFLGNCLGVGINIQKDTGILEVSFLVEDDGFWHIKSDGPFSSFWITDFEDAWEQFKDWLNRNAERVTWGWKLK